MINIKIILYLVIFVAILGLFTWFTSSSVVPNKVIKVGYLSSLLGSPHFIAEENGFYKEVGLNIESINFQSSNQLYDAVVSGQIDVAIELSVIPVFINESKDPGKVKIYSVTESTKFKPFDGLIVKKNSKIKSLKDLQNSKIGVFPGSTATVFLKEYLKENGVDISKIEFIQIPPTTQLQAFDAGSIDVLFAYEPTLTTALLKNNAVKVGDPIFEKYSDPNTLGAGIISTKFVEENPLLAGKLVEVYNKSYDFMKKHDLESRVILSKDLKIDSDVANNMSLIYHTKLSDINMENYINFLQVLVDFGELKSKPDLSNIFYK